MTSYLVTLPDGPATLEGDSNAVVVEANSVADARDMAEFASTIHAANWQAATATAIAAPADMLGWTLRVVVLDPADAGLPAQAAIGDYTYVGIATDDIDAMATAMELLTEVDFTSAYNATTQALTVATGTGVDDLGDHIVLAGLYPPGMTTTAINKNLFEAGSTGKGGVRGLIASITDQGLATADLTVTFAADAAVIPSVPVLARA